MPLSAAKQSPIPPCLLFWVVLDSSLSDSDILSPYEVLCLCQDLGTCSSLGSAGTRSTRYCVQAETIKKDDRLPPHSERDSANVPSASLQCEKLLRFINKKKKKRKQHVVGNMRTQAKYNEALRLKKIY